MKKTLFLKLSLTWLALLGAWRVQAADQDIRLGQERPKCFITLVTSATEVVTIGIENPPPTNVEWGFLNLASFSPAGICPETSINAYVCQGLSITVPTGAVSGSEKVIINWNGVAPDVSSLSFLLIVEGQTREYQINFRRPLDLAFVLDKSGSMSQISEGTITRWDALKTAAKNFMSKLSIPAFAKSSVDRVSLTFFENDITPSSFGSNLIPLSSGAAVMMETAINSLTPGTGTAMGKGINDAKSKLTNANRVRDILLFTDGDQNLPPYVNTNGCDVGGIPLNANCPVLPGSSGNLKIFTIGIGNPDPQYLTTLQNLATKNGGNCLVTSNGNSFTNTTSMVIGDINAIFLQAFINLLRDNSPQLVNSKAGTIGGAGQQLINFPLNKNVADLVIEVSLDKSFDIPQLFRLINTIKVFRNGQDVTSVAVPRWVGSTPNTFLYTFSFNTDKAYTNKLRSEGMWEVRALPNSPASGLPYRIVVIADDHALDYTCSQQNPQPVVNGTQKFSVRFSDRGKPVENAAITALVYRPGDDVGDLMARNLVKAAVPPRQQDRLSVGVLKYNQLLINDKSFVKALTPTEKTVTLTHRGNGLYEGNYAEMNVAGIYQIIFRIQGNDSIRGAYTRYEMQSMYVQPGQIDLSKSVIDKVISNGKVVMTVRPVTTYGRFLGPAATNAFDVNAPSVSLNNIVDNQDGSYTLTLVGDTKAAASISIMKQKVYSGRLDAVLISSKIPSVARPYRADAINVLINNSNVRLRSGTSLSPQNIRPRVNRIPR